MSDVRLVNDGWAHHIYPGGHMLRRLDKPGSYKAVDDRQGVYAVGIPDKADIEWLVLEVLGRVLTLAGSGLLWDATKFSVREGLQEGLGLKDILDRIKLSIHNAGCVSADDLPVSEPAESDDSELVKAVRELVDAGDAMDLGGFKNFLRLYHLELQHGDGRIACECTLCLRMSDAFAKVKSLLPAEKKDDLREAARGIADWNYTQFICDAQCCICGEIIPAGTDCRTLPLLARHSGCKPKLEATKCE